MSTDNMPTAPKRREANENKVIHRKIKNKVQQRRDVDWAFVALPDIMTVKCDKNGRHYVEDMNGVIRYYIDSETVETTDLFRQYVGVWANDQRDNDIFEMLGVNPSRY